MDLTAKFDKQLEIGRQLHLALMERIKEYELQKLRFEQTIAVMEPKSPMLQ
jgi:hypothetical protein